jgi:hypothetical protein
METPAAADGGLFLVIIFLFCSVSCRSWEKNLRKLVNAAATGRDSVSYNEITAAVLMRGRQRKSVVKGKVCFVSAITNVEM